VDFLTEYPRLEPAQQERFREVVTRLLSGHVLTPGSALRPDADWRFAERHRELIDGYLRLGGWRLDIDLALRLCRAVHESGEQRVRLSKLESLVLCALRLAYHEQMQQVSEDARCELTVGALRERLIHAGKPAWSLSRRGLEQSLRRLARHSVVTIERGFSAGDTETFGVSPLIEKVLPADRIAEMAERVRAYAGADARAGDGSGSEGGGPDDDEPEAEPDAREETA
jgi:hypothetical protein